MKTEIKNFFEKNWGLIILIIFIVVLLSLILAYNLNENFANDVRNIFTMAPKMKIEDFDILFFMNPTCPHCQDQLNIFKKEQPKGITVIDVSTEEGKNQAKAVGIPGVPFFISRKYNTTTIGFHSTKDLITDLTPKLQSQSNQQSNQQSQSQSQEPTIAVLTREGCPACNKAKEDISQKNPSGVIIIESSSPDAKQIISKFNIQSGYVPLYVNLTNGKYNEGFLPIEQVLEKIK
jgi:glutaredoxin